MKNMDRSSEAEAVLYRAVKKSTEVNVNVYLYSTVVTPSLDKLASTGPSFSITMIHKNRPWAASLLWDNLSLLETPWLINWLL